MTRLRRLVHRAALASLVAVAAVGCASTPPAGVLAPGAPRALPASGPVNVSWSDPASFSELRTSGNPTEAARGDWVVQLAGYLRDQATRQLPAGHRLDVTIVDIQRAGRYEPWRMDGRDVRMIRDIYPPRMTVKFKEVDAGGRIVAEGERKLLDPGFLVGIGPLNDSDPLRYEKRLIDAWVRREFRQERAGG